MVFYNLLMSVEQFREEVRAFLAESEASGVACPGFGTIMPPAFHERARRWQRHMFDHGFAGISWPARYGGQGKPVEMASVWNEECARSGIASYMNFQGVVLAGPAILRFGTDDQKEQHLEATISGQTLWCQLFSEPEAGSDLVSLATRAEPVDGGWSVTGQKVWSSTAHLAQQAILLARTDPHDRGHRGISFFLLDMATPGIDVRPLKQMTGDIEFCEVFLHEVHVPAENLLGELHGGWGVATAVLADERAGVGSAGIGLEKRLSALRAGREEPTGSSALDSVEVDHLMALQAAGGALGQMLLRGGGDPKLGPLSKLGLTEVSSLLARARLDQLGAGAMIESDAAVEFLYSPGMRIAGGTSEIQRNLIGERLLGLPREPRTQ